MQKTPSRLLVQITHLRKAARSNFDTVGCDALLSFCPREPVQLQPRSLGQIFPSFFFSPSYSSSQSRGNATSEWLGFKAGLWQTFFSASMGAQIPVIAEKPLATCGCRKFQLDPLGDHLNTCTAHSGAKKAHDWTVDQIADLFRTTHKVKTHQVVKSRGQQGPAPMAPGPPRWLDIPLAQCLHKRDI
jgi:hypothetical protein